MLPGAAYNYGEGESSSDSEEEASKRLASSKSFPSGLRDNHHPHASHNSNYHAYNHYGHHNNYHQFGPARSPSQYSAPEDGVPAHGESW